MKARVFIIILDVVIVFAVAIRLLPRKFFKGVQAGTPKGFLSYLQEENANEKSLPVHQHDNNHTSDYSWIGNQWIPPPHIPIYTPQQMREIWQHYKVLMLGDSTQRQDWATLNAILEGYGDVISVHDLNKNININKGHIQEYCTSRDFSKGLYSQEGFSNDTTFCRGDNDHKLDFTGSRCPHEVQKASKWESHPDGHLLSAEYNILVVELGVWEIVMTKVCRKDQPEQSQEERLVHGLESAYNVSSPNLTVFWKTVGSPAQGGGYIPATAKLNQQVRDWFQAKQPQYMHLVDWGKQILPRAEGKDRIKGDLLPHWGLEASGGKIADFCWNQARYTRHV